jgi:polyisoprenoid-binding protein YceI
MARGRVTHIFLMAAALAALVAAAAPEVPAFRFAGAAAARAAAFSAIPTGGFAIVPGRSSVTFAVPDNRGGFTGRTTNVSGRVDIEPAAGETYTARITGSIAARTLTTDNALRDRAMYATFLQTGTYPEITFAGTATARPGLAVRPFPAMVRGRLTIRNVTRDAEFTGTVLALAKQYVADAAATVRMADYGIPYPRAFIFVARDPVAITLHIVAQAP